MACPFRPWAWQSSPSPISGAARWWLFSKHRHDSGVPRPSGWQDRPTRIDSRNTTVPSTRTTSSCVACPFCCPPYFPYWISRYWRCLSESGFQKTGFEPFRSYRLWWYKARCAQTPQYPWTHISRKKDRQNPSSASHTMSGWVPGWRNAWCPLPDKDKRYRLPSGVFCQCP